MPENFHIEISRRFLGCNQGSGAEISKNFHSEINPNGWVHSLTAMGAHERPLFNKLRGSVVSCGIFIRSQSLIAR